MPETLAEVLTADKAQFVDSGTEEDKSTLDDGFFLMFVYGDSWGNMPVLNRHNRGANFAFADGHAENFRWVDPRTQSAANGVQQANNPDLKRLQQAYAGRATPPIPIQTPVGPIPPIPPVPAI